MPLSTRRCCARSCGCVRLRALLLPWCKCLFQVNSGSVLTLLSSPNAVSLELGERWLLKQRLYVELAALYTPTRAQRNPPTHC